MKNSDKTRSPWFWVPSLYFAEGVPYIIVTTVSILIFKQLGMNNSDVARFTSFLMFPWAIKPLWTPIVDLYRSKKWWVVTMQLAMAAAFLLAVFAMPFTAATRSLLAIFSVLALLSATHDAAADGIYVVSLKPNLQAFFTGIRGTFYRIAMITAQGGVVLLAGLVQQHTSLRPLEFSLEIKNAAVQPVELANEFFIVSTAKCALGSSDAKHLDPMIADYNADPSAEKLARITAAAQNVPLAFITLRDTGNSDRRQLALVRTADSRDKDVSFVGAERLLFTRDTLDLPRLARITAVANGADGSITSFRVDSGNFIVAWMVALGVLSGLYALLAVYHFFALPSDAGSASGVTDMGKFYREFAQAFVSFFTKRNVVVALIFILLFRFGESQLLKIGSTFMIDPVSKGGLGLSNSEYGAIYGVVGISCLLIGGIAGGWALSRQGLRFWMLPMALALNIPDSVYVLMAHCQPVDRFPVYLSVAVEQFGYGFGFSAYMMFMVWFASDSGKFATSHFAIMTGLQAIGLMVPGFYSGDIQENICGGDYFHFFVWVMIATLVSFAATVAAMRVIPKDYGKPQPNR